MQDPVKKEYPNAISIEHLKQNILKEIETQGLSPRQMVWATSLCSDEINHVFNGFDLLFSGAGAFIMGGLGGVPFVGATGMGAFLAHTPDDGAALIVYGPHIGIMPDGTLGKVQRQGQKKSTTCCGALAAALDTLDAKEEESKVREHQQDYLITTLHQSKEEIKRGKNPLQKATKVVYDAIHRELLSLVEQMKTAGKQQKIYLVGGVLINTSIPTENMFNIYHTEWVHI